VSQPVPPAYPEPGPAPDGADQSYSPAGLPFGGDTAPPQPSKAKKVLRVAGPLVVAGVAGASWLGLGGGGVPEVGDCGKPSGDDSFEVVDCGSDEAQFRVVGVEDEKMTQAEYEVDTTACTGFPTAEQILWVGDEFGLDGTVLCAGPV
jgi:hypothetical protein